MAIDQPFRSFLGILSPSTAYWIGYRWQLRFCGLFCVALLRVQTLPSRRELQGAEASLYDPMNVRHLFCFLLLLPLLSAMNTMRCNSLPLHCSTCQFSLTVWSCLGSRRPFLILIFDHDRSLAILS